MKKLMISMIILAFMSSACKQGTADKKASQFNEDLNFLKKHTEMIVLSSESSMARVAIAPAWQGRVMTSTTGQGSQMSFGWINRELIASGKLQEHINVFGGEDRFWLGPEGGQFSIFFDEGVPFDLENWFVPAEIDTEPFDVVKQDKSSAVFSKDMLLKNYSGSEFKLNVNREVKMTNLDELLQRFGLKKTEKIQGVSYVSINQLKNIGKQAWTKNTGLLSVWILAMLKHSPNTTVVVPFEAGEVDELGPIVNDEYFGKVPSDRLVVKDGVVYFKGDGQYRSKIGLSPQRSKPVLGSYDAVNKVLTIIEYTKPEDATDYVNSMWELQENPYSGDVVNSYNDGPPAPGKKPLGPFYELETSSPAAALQPGEVLLHSHHTIHLQGPEAELSIIAKKILGTDIQTIKSIF